MPFLGFSNSCISLKILYFPCACNFISETSRGEGFTKQSFIWGGHALRYSDPSPFVQCIPFLTEKLHVLLLHSFCPFHIHVPPCNLQLCKFMHCLFKKLIWITYKTRTFSQLFHSHKCKMHLVALLALLQTKMRDFPTPSHASTKEIRTLS